MKIENIVFDFGGVLVDWNPRYLYREIFKNENDMEFFLENICTEQWNLEQDRGRSLAEGTTILQQQFPEYHDLIQLYYDKWEKMLKCEIPESVSLLKQLDAKKYNIFGLTNWSAETISIAYNRFEFFNIFQGIIVSGEEKLIKPDPAIFDLLLQRYKLQANQTLFIDDNINNINTAKKMGFHTIHFTNTSQAEGEIRERHLI